MISTTLALEVFVLWQVALAMSYNPWLMAIPGLLKRYAFFWVGALIAIHTGMWLWFTVYVFLLYFWSALNDWADASGKVDVD